MTQSYPLGMVWHDLLFAHWPVKPEALRPLLPRGLELDTFGGDAWLGVVPFRMTGVGPRRLPSIPGISEFGELNVRTYATTGGRSGVWFFSLDAANALAVRVARWRFHLPYFDAKISCVERDGWISYRCLRTHRRAMPAEFAGRYRPCGAPVVSARGSLEHWLTERYCLFSADRRGTLYRGDIRHDPWPLQGAEAEIEANRMTALLGFDLAGAPAYLHFARRLDVVAAELERVEGG